MRKSVRAPVGACLLVYSRAVWVAVSMATGVNTVVDQLVSENGGPCDGFLQCRILRLY